MPFIITTIIPLQEASILCTTIAESIKVQAFGIATCTSEQIQEKPIQGHAVIALATHRFFRRRL